ncbi:MAG: PilT protein domain protein [Acidobacteriaceae bacterium]|nr:PilT protein domain protein [Acidobacteriaceae bacterium]
MGLILDTDFLISAERQSISLSAVLQQLKRYGADSEIGISSITVAELTHGIYRARSEQQMRRRAQYVDQICREIVIHPLSESIARLLGRIEGEQAAQDIAIAFQDLAIGATALSLNFAVVTHNSRHFGLIPGLTVQNP